MAVNHFQLKMFKNKAVHTRAHTTPFADGQNLNFKHNFKHNRSQSGGDDDVANSWWWQEWIPVTHSNNKPNSAPHIVIIWDELYSVNIWVAYKPAGCSVSSHNHPSTWKNDTSQLNTTSRSTRHRCQRKNVRERQRVGHNYGSN